MISHFFMYVTYVEVGLGQFIVVLSIGLDL